MAPRREGLQGREVGGVGLRLMEEWMLIRCLSWKEGARFAVAGTGSLGRVAKHHGGDLVWKMRFWIRDRGPRLCWLLRLGRSANG